MTKNPDNKLYESYIDEYGFYKIKNVPTLLIRLNSDYQSLYRMQFKEYESRSSKINDGAEPSINLFELNTQKPNELVYIKYKYVN